MATDEDYLSKILQTIAARCTKYISDSNVVTNEKSVIYINNIIDVNVNSENTNACLDCLRIFFDENIIKDLNNSNYIELTKYYRKNVCFGTCATEVTGVKQDAHIFINSNVDIQRPSTSQVGDMVDDIYTEFQNSGVGVLKNVTKTKINSIIDIPDGSNVQDWITTVNTAMSTTYQQVVVAVGTGITISHVSESVVIDAVYDAINSTRRSLLLDTVEDAVYQESKKLVKFVDDSFLSQAKLAIQSMQLELIGLGVTIVIIVGVYIVMLIYK